VVAALLALVGYRVAFVMITTHRRRLHRSQHPEM
jgi:positive regulator of sigma E activity